MDVVNKDEGGGGSELNVLPDAVATGEPVTGEEISPERLQPTTRLECLGAMALVGYEGEASEVLDARRQDVLETFGGQPHLTDGFVEQVPSYLKTFETPEARAHATTQYLMQALNDVRESRTGLSYPSRAKLPVIFSSVVTILNDSREEDADNLYKLGIDFIEEADKVTREYDDRVKAYPDEVFNLTLATAQLLSRVRTPSSERYGEWDRLKSILNRPVYRGGDHWQIRKIEQTKDLCLAEMLEAAQTGRNLTDKTVFNRYMTVAAQRDRPTFLTALERAVAMVQLRPDWFAEGLKIFEAEASKNNLVSLLKHVRGGAWVAEVAKLYETETERMRFWIDRYTNLADYFTKLGGVPDIELYRQTIGQLDAHAPEQLRGKGGDFLVDSLRKKATSQLRVVPAAAQEGA